MKILFGMKHLNITQGRNGGYSHSNPVNLNAYDLAGKDAGIDSFRCFDPKGCTVTSTWESGYTFYFPTINCTLLMFHDDNINWRVGTKINYGKSIYDEGNYGNSTGNHIHLEICKGNKKGGWVTRNDGNQYWSLQSGSNKMVNIEEVFYLDDSIKIINSQNYNFKKKIPSGGKKYCKIIQDLRGSRFLKSKQKQKYYVEFLETRGIYLNPELTKKDTSRDFKKGDKQISWHYKMIGNFNIHAFESDGGIYYFTYSKTK